MNDKFRECLNNVVPEFDGKDTEEIKNILRERSVPCAVAMMQIEGDFNFSNIVRTANALGMREAFYVGPRKKWDRRGCVGTYLYTDVTYLNDVEELFALKSKYSIVALEQKSGSVKLQNFVWPKNSLILVGEEGRGLSPEIIERCDHVVEIPQRGSVRSMNAATAAGIAMWNCCVQI